MSDYMGMMKGNGEDGTEEVIKKSNLIFQDPTTSIGQTLKVLDRIKNMLVDVAKEMPGKLGQMKSILEKTENALLAAAIDSDEEASGIIISTEKKESPILQTKYPTSSANANGDRKNGERQILVSKKRAATLPQKSVPKERKKTLQDFEDDGRVVVPLVKHIRDDDQDSGRRRGGVMYSSGAKGMRYDCAKDFFKMVHSRLEQRNAATIPLDNISLASPNDPKLFSVWCVVVIIKIRFEQEFSKYGHTFYSEYAQFISEAYNKCVVLVGKLYAKDKSEAARIALFREMLAVYGINEVQCACLLDVQKYVIEIRDLLNAMK